MRRLFTRVVALAAGAVVAAAPALAQDVPPGEPTSDEGETEAVDAAVLARFTAFTDAQTLERLQQLQSSDDQAEALGAVLGLLAQDGVTPEQLEGPVLPLVEGRTPEQVDEVLGAVMLAHYQAQVQGQVTAAPEAFKHLVQRGQVLDGAVYGLASGGTRPVARKMLRR